MIEEVMFDSSFDRKRYTQQIQERLKILRTAANVTQKEAAEALGLVRSTYVNYELGSKELPWEKCLACLFFFQKCNGSRELIEALKLIPENSHLE